MVVVKTGKDSVMPSSCAFCKRGTEDGVKAIIGSKLQAAPDGTPVGICVDCSKNTLYTFMRAAELAAEAKRLSDKLTAEGNDHGICTCPGCVMEQLMKEDGILHALEAEHASYRAEEIIPATRH